MNQEQDIQNIDATETESASGSFSSDTKENRIFDEDEQESQNTLKITISKKRSFLDNIQGFMFRYRNSEIDFKKDGKITIYGRGGTISMLFWTTNCIIKEWCPELKIENIRMSFVGKEEQKTESVQNKIRNYENNTVVQLDLVRIDRTE